MSIKVARAEEPVTSLQGSGWFACPNAVFEKCETAYEILVVTYLLRRAGPDGSCWPSLTTIARDTKLSEATVKRTLASLESRSILTRERRPRNGDRHESTMYQVRVGFEWGLHRPSVGLTQSPSGAQGEPRTRPTEQDPMKVKEIPSFSPLTDELRKITGKHLPRGSSVALASMRSRFGEETVLAAIRHHVTKLANAQNPLTYLEAILTRAAEASKPAPSPRENRRYTPEEEFEHRFGGLPDGHPARVAAEIRLGRRRAGGTDAGAVPVQMPAVSGQGGGAVPETGRSGGPPLGEAVSALSEGR